MRYYTARQVIHDAFMPDVTSIDTSAMILEFGVQFTAKGGDGKTMTHCGKGIIQQALEVQRSRDELSWAWNLFAYAPVGMVPTQARSVVLRWLMRRLAADEGGGALHSVLPALARIAMHDVALQDTLGKRRRRRYADLARVVGLDEDDYKSNWHRYYVRFRGYCLGLPERSLPPIASVVWMMLDKQEGRDVTDELGRALKMPEGAV